MPAMIRILQIAAIVLVLSSCDSHQHKLVLARPDSPVDADIAANLVELLGDEASIDLVLADESMTGGEALKAIEAGQVDVALISNDQPFSEDIATVMPLYATVLHIVHRADVAPTGVFELLRDATVYAGEEGSASRRVFERLTANVDLGEEPYTYVTDRAQVADVAVVFAPISPDRLAEYPGLTLWSIGTPDDIGAGGPVDAAVLLNPHFRPFVVPVGTYGTATPEPVVTIAVDKILVTRRDLDRSVVYFLINEIQRLRPALATIHPGLFQSVGGDFDASRSRFILHAGTQDYLQRSEPTYIERYSGVAEVLVTLMIGGISAAFAGIRIYSLRRKNRIDRYYSKVIDIRKSISAAMGDSERDEAAREVRELQDEAFKLLVDEKLAADESFRIFITLSNDVLDQISGISRN